MRGMATRNPERLKFHHGLVSLITSPHYTSGGQLPVPGQRRLCQSTQCLPGRIEYLKIDRI
jgi:hypothetical protein